MTLATPTEVQTAPEHNRTGEHYSRSIPRPPVRGTVVDIHCHLLAARHAPMWFAAADHYGVDYFATMTPLEEAATLVRDWGHRLHLIAVPSWGNLEGHWLDDYLWRLEAFYNLGSRIVKFHMAPQTIARRKWQLDHPDVRRVLREAVDRGMAIMTHVGDPDTWYAGKYSDASVYGTRDAHYQVWEQALDEFRGVPWIGAHLGGNPENLPRLQHLLDRFEDLVLDCSATRWMAREISLRRDAAREFFIHNSGRILFGSDQVSGDARDFDFLASRFWVHRKLWETAWIGRTPIHDPDLSAEHQPVLRGLALPGNVLQRLYHDNSAAFLSRLGVVAPGI